MSNNHNLQILGRLNFLEESRVDDMAEMERLSAMADHYREALEALRRECGEMGRDLCTETIIRIGKRLEEIGHG